MSCGFSWAPNYHTICQIMNQNKILHPSSKLSVLPNLVRVSLGPTILRAETAAIVLAGALHLETYG